MKTQSFSETHMGLLYFSHLPPLFDTAAINKQNTNFIFKGMGFV